MIRLTRAQVREVDRIAIEEYGIPGIVLMENAARGVADQAIKMLGDAMYPHIHIVCGGGNNAGDGFAVARMLSDAGFTNVIVIDCVAPESLPPDARTNYDRLDQTEVMTEGPLDDGVMFHSKSATLIIDALFGTGLTHPPRPRAADVIQMMNNAGAPILAIDLPSGLDCDSGLPLGEYCVRATKTVTFVAEKAGFANGRSREFTGEVIVADIGAPPEIVARVVNEPRA